MTNNPPTFPDIAMQTYLTLNKEANMHKKLGKIRSAKLGLGGYQGAQIGIWFDLGGDGWGVGDGKGQWSGERSKHAIWTDEDRIKSLGEMVMYIDDLLRKAKVDSLDKLKGIPVEITLDGPYGKLESWRILEEVL